MRILKENVLQDYPQLKPVYDFGKRKHDATGKIRMNSGLPYWVHPDMVAEVVAAYGGTDDEIAAALLHDTREDTDTTAEEIERLFGPDIAQIVEEVTNFEPDVKRLGKEQYINKELMELSPSALFVKVADMYCNLNDSPKPGQRERIVRNLLYIIEFRKDLPTKVKRLLKSIPEIEDLYNLDEPEFEDSFDEFSEEPMYLVSSKKKNFKRRIFSWDLEKSEFEDSLDDDDFEETPGIRLVSSRKIRKNKLSERRRRRRNWENKKPAFLSAGFIFFMLLLLHETKNIEFISIFENFRTFNCSQFTWTKFCDWRSDKFNSVF